MCKTGRGEPRATIIGPKRLQQISAKELAFRPFDLDTQ